MNIRMTAGTKRRYICSTLACLVCIAWMVAAAVGQSEGVTIRSGSKTITIRRGKSDFDARTMAVDDFIREMLDAHNGIRARVGVPPLQWSDELAAYAQKWADSLIAADTLTHSSDAPYGENILASGLGSTPSWVVGEWAYESNAYSYATNTCDGDCGHYTQLVWRNTRKVGCGIARNNRREIWVCSYDPAGNTSGKWPY
jgi:pathogenesis-related protein 1